ncbi:MAG: isoprenylcysteine carboxylmethyltransferase family protein [Hyphomicrobiaceae bacterium]
MAVALFVVGVFSAVVLLGLLAWTWWSPQLRIWPPPTADSWQSNLFWPLFRVLNVAAFATAIADNSGYLELPSYVRGVAVVALGISGVAYAYALLALGKRNTYCNAAGLVTHGIYRWTRNPQYSTVIPVYASLAVAADSGMTYVLCAAMVAVYVMMALLEEPWLEAAYGDVYRRYRRRVPRFFNWHRARVLIGWTVRSLLRQMQDRFQMQGQAR